MSVKDKVLRTLEINKGKSFSGESLAVELGVSRAAIWKAITALRKDGYPIEAANNRGYALTKESDILSEQGISLCLERLGYFENFNRSEELNRQSTLYVYKTIDSTNLEAKRLALAGASHGDVIVSNEQTKGRGRLGRDFYSPASSGIYMTVLLKPTFDLSKSVLITTAASVAVSRAIKNVCDVETQIKWVNDVYAGNLKICGILTEAITDFETGSIEYIALGIGVNCHIPKGGFPEDLKDKAGVLDTYPEDKAVASEASFSRNKLAAEIIHQVMDIYDHVEDRGFILEYKERSMVIGKEIQVVRHYNKKPPSQNPEAQSAVALDIDCDGGLLVEFEDGNREVLNTGEISIRL